MRWTALDCGGLLIDKKIAAQFARNHIIIETGTRVRSVCCVSHNTCALFVAAEHAHLRVHADSTDTHTQRSAKAISRISDISV